MTDDGLRAFDDVVVGDHVTLFVDHEAGAGRGAGPSATEGISRLDSLWTPEAVMKPTPSPSRS